MPTRSATPSFRDRLEAKLEKMIQRSIRKQGLKADLSKAGEPTALELEEIIESYARKAATVAAGFSLVPGPFGMVLLLKELQTIMQTQIDLLAYLTIRLRREEQVTPEIIMAIFSTLLGNVGITLLASQGEKILIKAIAGSAAKEAGKHLTTRLLQKSGYHFAAKWIPIAGSALMYHHTFRSIRRLGVEAVELLDRGIVIETEAA